MGLGNFLKNLFGLSNQNVDQMANKASVLGDEAFEKIKEAATPLVEKAEGFAEVAKEKVSEYVPTASEAIENAIETVKEKAG